MSYTAFIAKITAVHLIEGANTIQSATILGSNIVVSKTVALGDIGILFPEEGQLSEEYATVNDLVRRKNPITGEHEGGFFEENRRVRTQKFMKVRSEGYFAPLSSLEYTGADVSKLSPGDSLTELNGHPLCEKYISRKTRDQSQRGSKQGRSRTWFAPYFREHVETDQLRYYIDRIPSGSVISISAKLHGTSGRYGWCPVELKLPRWKHIVNRLLVKYVPGASEIFSKSTWEFLSGTRRVILDTVKGDQFYRDSNFRQKIAENLEAKFFGTCSYIIYGEIVGWTGIDTPIMARHSTVGLKDKNYTSKYGREITYKYGCENGTFRFYVYRVSLLSAQGDPIDLSVPQMLLFCEKHGLTPVPQLVPPFIFDGDVQSLLSRVDALANGTDVLGEDWLDASHIREGVVVRVDGASLTPHFYKHKNFYFKVMEGIAKEDAIDLEDAS